MDAIILKLHGLMAEYLSPHKIINMENYNPEHTEVKVATAIEEQTAKLPSDLFL